jgi:hypothetical protein
MVFFRARSTWPQRGPVDFQYLDAAEGMGRQEANALVALGLATEERDGKSNRLLLTEIGVAVRDGAAMPSAKQR